MSRVFSFPPLSRPDARVLVLGSMPGVASLQAGRYYAHPRNAFWPIMATLFGFAVDLPYAGRVERLLAAGVAVWDVLQACERAGSGDADIDPASVAVNDFAGFFAAHPQMNAVFLNGATAAAFFQRRVWPGVQALRPALTATTLPSTSPAHAGLRPADKLDRWRVVAVAAQPSPMPDC